MVFIKNPNAIFFYFGLIASFVYVIYSLFLGEYSKVFYLVLTSYLLARLIYGCFSVFLHRQFVHGSFETNRFLKYIGVTIPVIYNHGCPISFRLCHLIHHKKCDTKDDPHSPLFEKNTLLHYINLQLKGSMWKAKCPKSKDKFYQFLSDYEKWLLFGFSLLILLLFGIEGWITYHILPSIFATTFNAISGLYSHKKTEFSYRPYSTKDNSHNDFLLGLFFVGAEAHHNNHHANPKSYAFGERWWEIDFGKIFIHHILRKLH